MRIMSREEEITSNYMEICLYNKTKQIEKAIAEDKAPETESSKFVNVFRTEVKYKNGKLNSRKHKRQASDKSLKTYYNTEATTELYNNTIQKLFGTNDFFRIDVALGIVKKADDMRQDTKKKLINLLRRVNAEGYTKAKEYWTKKYSEPTFRAHKKKIESLGLNILTFDTKIDGFDVKTERIKNFTSLENSVQNNMKAILKGDNDDEIS